MPIDKPTKRIVAAKSMRYAGRAIAAGETFEASAKDAKLLTKIKKATEAPAVLVQPPPVQPPLQEKATEEVREDTRGRYRRRDMRAEE